MQLNEAQREAVEYLGGPLLVLAGPGTGKTQLLSQKVAYILQNTDTGAENILCLTFTDTGARNMRERLRSIIGKDALKVTIGTYHTFGSEILGLYKNYSEDYDRRLDAAIDEVRQYKIISEIQAGLDGTDILRGDAAKDIISVISDAKGAGLSAADLRAVALTNIEDSKVLSEAISPLLEQVVPRKYRESYELAYKPIYNFLKDYKNLTIIKNIERNINELARDLEKAINESESINKITPLTTWRNRYFEKDAKGNWRLKDGVANKKLLSIAGVMEEYERYLYENGLFDFDDMIEEAVKALEMDAGFRMTLQEKYQFILLDEFQDTNPSQFAIVKRLTDYEQPMIMAVGDDDQAIYEFQGALSSNLADFREHYGAKVVTLTENYRSTQEILDFSHEIIKQAPDRFGDKELTAHRAAPAESQICRYEFGSSDAEYGFIADKISELVASGVRQSEIAVISYKTKYFEPLLPYLKAKDGIKIAYEKRDNLFEDERIHEILTVARYARDTAKGQKSTVQIMELLTYPCFGVSALEVVRLVEQARARHFATFDYLAEKGSESVRAALEWLAELAAKSFTAPLDDIMLMIVQKVGSVEMGEYERFRFYENVASLKGKLVRHFGDKALRLGDLVEMVDDYEAAGMALNTTSPYKDAAEAVQILTAHKAKGLEFEYVFIISADHTAWGKGKGNNSLLTLPKNLIQIRHTGMTDGERLRILYVALTRAKKSLIVTNSLADFNGKSPERLEYLEESVQKNEAEEDEVVSPFLPTGKVIEVREVGDVLARENNVRNWLASYVVESPDMREIYRERVEGLRMSASALTTFVDVRYGGPTVFFERYILRAPSEVETEALVLGNLIHATFEEVTRAGLTDEAAVEFYLDLLEKSDTTPEIKQALRSRGPESIAATLRDFGEVVRTGFAEVNFGAERLVVDGVPISGKIDHLVIDEANKTIEVYDYKTGGYKSAGWKSHPGMYQYMLQLLFYKMLLNASPKYRNYTVTRGHILFVVPGKADGVVHDKEYIYNSEDEKEFRELLRGVYETIVSLAFLDDKELFVVPDKNRTMKDVREFIGLVLAKSATK